MRKNGYTPTKKILSLCVGLFLVTQVSSQTLRLPRDGFMEGWSKHNKLLHFERGRLFDYINRGAELFLEFGFEELFVQHYRRQNQEISIEVYCMESPEAALGIYLMKCGQETPSNEIPVRNTADSYQFLLIKNNYFLLINNFKGKKELIPVMTELTRKTIDAIPEGMAINMFSLLPQDDLVEGSQKIVRGPYSLQTIYTFGKGDILQLKGKISGVTADYKNNNGRTSSRIIIPYPDKKTASQAYSHLLSNLDSHLEILDEEKTCFIFRDYKNEYGIVVLDGEKIDIKVNLSKRPGLRFKANHYGALVQGF